MNTRMRLEYLLSKIREMEEKVRTWEKKSRLTGTASILGTWANDLEDIIFSYANHWIDAGVAVPESEGLYLAYYESGSVKIVRWEDERWKTSSGTNITAERITHWQPVPADPNKTDTPKGRERYIDPLNERSIHLKAFLAAPLIEISIESYMALVNADCIVGPNEYEPGMKMEYGEAGFIGVLGEDWKTYAAARVAVKAPDDIDHNN